MEHRKLRVITFNYLPSCYHFASEWIHNNNHEHVLLVTTPGPLSRPTPSYMKVVKDAPRVKDILVTTRLAQVAEPLIRALKPDLILSFSFPYRIPPEICAIPTFGAVNVHPSVLPAYRGPNPMRQFYDGASVFGSSTHWIAPDYDTGNVLSTQSANLPAMVTQNVVPQWADMIRHTISDGLARAIDGDPGIPQDNNQAIYAAAYSEEEKWLNFNEPTHIIQRKVFGLDVCGGMARAEINGTKFRVSQAEPVSGCNGKAGTILDKTNHKLVVGTGDGAVRLQTHPLTSRCPTPLEQLQG
uniref:Methionyl-tRNA formyltransferase n=1 Tax=uncultured Thiotrichaceae bacterium TaxID=298394 RepID=A0A6S6SG85_9GAMM|nr:MAG: Putative Methionyl-tRNA formyltransferase [uncultured Thiotrichaceae bacterium]